MLRTQVTVPRLLGVGSLGALSVLLGTFARWDDDPVRAAAQVVAAYGLGIVVPLAALWFGTSAIGDLVEDRLLVYLWLKPVPRWQLPAAAVLATVTLVAPLTALPLAASALAAGAGELAPAALLAASLAVCAYAGLFVAAGLWFRRAVWWGLAFVLLWENGAAYASEGTERFTVTSWARSIVSTVQRGRGPARRAVRRFRTRRPARRRRRRLAGCDGALPPRRRRLKAALPAARRHDRAGRPRRTRPLAAPCAG